VSAGLIPVEEAQARLLAGAALTPAARVPLGAALDRVLAEPLAAKRKQPPFPASAMDGYAVRAADAGAGGARLALVGEARAGGRYPLPLQPGEAVRIFTGAPVPDGADAILIQENAEREGTTVTVLEPVAPGRFVRAAGLDFREGDVLLQAGHVMDPRAVALAAAMNHAEIGVRRRPRVALLSTGDELVTPGGSAGPDQIVSANGHGLSALVAQAGGEPLDLGIAPDDLAAIRAGIGKAAGADILVTIGGASVGDHDLIGEALAQAGMALDFWRIAMRPGKPLLVGRLGDARVVGLPGNPVSAFVCGLVFLAPLIRAMLGLPPGPRMATARLGGPLPENDRRQDYLRATLGEDAEGTIATPFPRQDSSMLATLARADALILRAPFAPAAAAGERVTILPLGGSV